MSFSFSKERDVEEESDKNDPPAPFTKGESPIHLNRRVAPYRPRGRTALLINPAGIEIAEVDLSPVASPDDHFGTGLDRLVTVFRDALL